MPKVIDEQFKHAIPTTYRGIQFKSRLEAQCAVMLDKMSCHWTYEPTSFMLPSGVAFTPDFLVKGLGFSHVYVECRGYKTRRGERQIDELGEIVLGRPREWTDIECILNFITIGPDDVSLYAKHAAARQPVSFGKCNHAGWRIVGACDVSCSCDTGHPNVNISLYRGKILLNGLLVEDWNAPRS